MEDYRENYLQWLQTASSAERELYDTVLEYDSAYFEDMLFRDGSVVTPFLEYEAMDGGSTRRYCEELPASLTMMEENYYTFRIRDVEEDNAAETDHSARSVTFAPEYAGDKATVLHEMIHVHEQILSAGVPVFRDILLYCLKDKLAALVPDLEARVIRHAHLIPGLDITAQGGSHSILFYLKSLDLDIRCGFPLGTVCGYGRDEG